VLSGASSPPKRGSMVDLQSENTESADSRRPAWPQSHGEVAALVDAYAGRLVRYAFRQLGDYQDAEDVVQQVFVRAFVDQSNRQKVSAVGPYLYRSVANACTDLLRRRDCAAVFREEISTEQLLAGSDGPAEIAQAAEGLRRAESLLAHLPKEQAEAIRLRVFDGLRLGEIAEVLGCPMNTVCSRLRYGFQKLRNIVGGKRE
jgi:RNA polymerase sigma-70 factor (ECF subfamily)